MAGEKLDAIIFGASGFTGQIVVEDALEILKNFKWGIAGRNEVVDFERFCGVFFLLSSYTYIESLPFLVETAKCFGNSGQTRFKRFKLKI